MRCFIKFRSYLLESLFDLKTLFCLFVKFLKSFWLYKLWFFFKINIKAKYLSFWFIDFFIFKYNVKSIGFAEAIQHIEGYFIIASILYVFVMVLCVLIFATITI
jgi:hypothetical protein